MNLSEKYDGIKFPVLIANEEGDSFTLSIGDKSSDLKLVSKYEYTIKSLLNRVKGVLDIVDIDEALENGDELFYDFKLQTFINTKQFVEKSLELLDETYKTITSEIDPEWTKEVIEEMTNNIKIDLAASFVTVHFEELLDQMISTANELNITQIAFAGNFIDNPRINKIILEQLKINNIEALFPKED
jgi:hydrogenase maturation factor HypF (carbamoyltransferase family)